MKVSISLERTKNFTARLIHIGMWLWCVLRYLKPTITYNHAEVRYGEVTSGAISPRVTTRFLSQHLNKYKNKYHKCLTFDIELTEEQWTKGKAYLDKAEGTPYEYTIFVFHTIKIFTGKWKGDTTNKRTACYEHMIRFLNATGKYNINPLWNPYQFEMWAVDNLK